MKKLSIIIIAFVVVGCFSARPPKVAPPSTGTPSVPVQSDIEMAQAKFPNYTVAELAEGKTLYVQNCGSCHPLKNVPSYTEAEWKILVPDMCNKVNSKEPILDAVAQQKILTYVVAVSNASR